MNLRTIFALEFLLACGIIAADRFTKIIALAHCASEQIITSFASCVLTYNRGISWGMLHDSQDGVFWLVTILIASVTVYIAYLGIERWRMGESVVSYVCVVAGSVSNVIDRILYGAVIDFIYFSWGGWHFPVFNVADIFIVCGVFMIAWDILWYKKA